MTLLPLLYTLALAQPTPDYIKDAAKRWDNFGLDAQVVSVDCGEANAYYYPDDELVVMCTELYEDPDLSVFVFNHEMGHAFMYQRGILNSEQGADEMAFLMSSDDQVAAAATWFMLLAIYSTGDDGEHQPHLERAGMLLCLMDGRDDDPVDRVCSAYESSVWENWTRLLVLTEP